VRGLLRRFANTQLDRRGVTTIQSLVVLVRRYYGYRHPVVDMEHVPWESRESERSDEHAIEFEDEDGDDTVMIRKGDSEPAIFVPSGKYLTNIC
jgi:hypothetical protein